jgi:hypothetical protein
MDTILYVLQSHNVSNFDAFNVSCLIISYSIEPWRNCVWKMSMRELPNATKESVGREKESNKKTHLNKP